MATINLGAIKFNWKGAYNSSTTYAVDDVVSSSGNSYVCIQAHSNQAVGNATAYWNIMSLAGTNGTDGTDISTTLTVQGDMLYRDGSGLQKLAKGTASQELRMNSGATAPEWHTPAVATSDYVKILTYDIASTVAAFNMQGWINSAYKFYIVRGYYKMVNSNDYFNVRLMNNSGNVVTSNYLWSSAHYYVQSGGTATTNTHGDGGAGAWRPVSSNSTGTSMHGQFEMHFSHENLTASEQTGCMWQSYSKEQTGQVDGWSAVGWQSDSTAYSNSHAGLNFDRGGSGSFGDGTVTIYGIK